MTMLFDPIQLGAIAAPNRILMAPLTRGRNTRDHVPTTLMVDYYRQRASAGLIISEATGISQQGLGWPYGPGIWDDAQVEGWRRVTEAVHGAGGRVMCQLWHMGRVVHPSLPGRGQPVSASSTTAPGMAMTYEGPQPHVQARPLAAEEIPALLEDYRRATHNAMQAGFDGVQLHGANGYLIDQFLRDAANQRHDVYGGPPENRIRLLMHVTKAISEVAGADRTSVRISPNGNNQGINDRDPAPLFSLAAEGLSALGLAFLEVKEPPPGGTRGTPDHPPVAPVIRKMFKGPMVLNSDFDAVRAPAALAEGLADAIAFGRHFIGNPDLVYRLAHGLPLAPTRRREPGVSWKKKNIQVVLANAADGEQLRVCPEQVLPVRGKTFSTEIRKAGENILGKGEKQQQQLGAGNRVGSPCLPAPRFPPVGNSQGPSGVETALFAPFGLCTN